MRPQHTQAFAPALKANGGGAITASVKSAFVADPTLKATEINVETYKGIVQLSGFVAQQGDIANASTVARNVKGVKSVKNDIRLK